MRIRCSEYAQQQKERGTHDSSPRAKRDRLTKYVRVAGSQGEPGTVRDSAHASRSLGHYVYVYINPRGRSIFYVGRGQGNRAFAHISSRTEGPTVDRLEEIAGVGVEPVIEIVAHGLRDATEAGCVEAALIDALGGPGKLTNRVRGIDASTLGRMDYIPRAPLSAFTHLARQMLCYH